MTLDLSNPAVVFLLCIVVAAIWGAGWMWKKLDECAPSFLITIYVLAHFIVGIAWGVLLLMSSYVMIRLTLKIP